MKLFTNPTQSLTHKLSRGFTIVELLIYMGLVAVLLTILSSIFLSALEAQLSSQASSASLTAGRYILTRLEYDLHRSTSLNVPAVLGQSSTSLVVSAGGTSLSFALESGNLTLTTGGTTRVLNDIGTTVTDLKFTRLGNTGGKPTVLISFTVTGTDSTPPEVRTFETTIGLR